MSVHGVGFAALPAAGRAKPWRDALGVGEDAGPETVRNAYRELARLHHPDAGGSDARMAEINAAYAAAQKEGAAP